MADHPAPSPVDDGIEGDEKTTYPPPPPSDPPLQLRAPYDRLDGDVILRCSDNVGFRVHRLILVLASPVFADMFSLPQPATAGSESVVSPIDLTEDSKSILPLLDACYPFGDPTLDDLDTIDRVLDAAAKYDVAKATQFSQRRLHAFVSGEPLRAFAIACRMHFEDVASAAADRAHALSIFKNGLVYVKELDRVSAGCYHRLLQHYRRRGNWKQIRFCPPDRDQPRAKRHGRKKRNEAPPHHCQNSPPQARNAPHPFRTESHTHAEITTSDHVRFGVSQEFILSAAPGVARRLVPAAELSPDDHGVADEANTSLLDASASREPEDQIGRPSVHSCARFSTTIEEDSELFLPLLQLCHPDAVPILPWEDLCFIRGMVDAARKYNMKKAIWFVQSEWQRSISLDPFRAYILASSWGWTAQARASVAVLMRDTSEQIEARYTPDMEELLTGPYFRLLSHHAQRVAAITAAASDAWVLPSDIRKAVECQYCGGFGSKEPKWLRMVCTRAKELAASRPSPDTVREGLGFVELMHLIQQEARYCSKSPSCPWAFNSHVTIAEALASVVRNIVSKVQYDLFEPEESPSDAAASHT